MHGFFKCPGLAVKKDSLMNRLLFSFLQFLILSSIVLDTYSDPLPDYYAEPGYSAFRDYELSGPVETIDPFSGGLGLLYTDLVIPGDGGLDIVVQRYYRAPSRYESSKIQMVILKT